MIVVVCVCIGWAWRMCVGVGACVRVWVSEGGGQEGYFFSAVIICIMDFVCYFVFVFLFVRFCPLCLLSSI